MKKEKYFKLVKKINKKLRKKGFVWNRTYSESRLTGTGYRTKLWCVYTNYIGADIMVRQINEKYGGEVVAKKVMTRVHHDYDEYSIVIKPLKKIKI